MARRERKAREGGGTGALGFRTSEERRSDKLAGWERKAQEGRLGTRKMTKLGMAQSSQRAAALDKPTTRADYRVAQEAATADIGALGQGQMVGQMDLPGQMAGQFVQEQMQRQGALSADVLKGATSEVDLVEQIAAKKLAAEEARLLQLMALKKSSRKGAATVAVGATQGAATV
tara:strand:- start:5154 stop:5675 length:522 start_codon:yes stop_codon:yes gene_type:complete